MLNALEVLPLDARLSDYLKGYFHVRTSLCRLCGFNIFWYKTVSSLDICHHFPWCIQVVIPLIGDVTDAVVTRAWTKYWIGPSPCSVVVIALLVVKSASKIVEWKHQDQFLIYASDLQCEVGGIGALTLRGRLLSLPPLELFTHGFALLCHILPGVWALRLHCFGHCSWSYLNHWYESIWPWNFSDVVFNRPPA